MSYSPFILRRFVFLACLLTLLASVFLFLAFTTAGYAQQNDAPVLLADDISFGGHLTVRGYNFTTGETYDIKLQTGSGPVDLGGLTAARGGVILPASLGLPRGTPPGDYTLEAHWTAGGLVATTTFTIRPAPTVQLNPTTGPPGTLVEITVDNLVPGTLQVDFNDAAVIGPLTWRETSYSGRFVVPGGRQFPISGTVEVKATNRLGRAVIGEGTTTFNLEPPQLPPVYTITNVAISTSALRSGNEFAISGQISPPPGDDAAELQLVPYWRQLDRRTQPSSKQAKEGQSGYIEVPVSLSPASINPDGTFQIAARTPTLLGGDPISGRDGDDIKLTLITEYGLLTKTHPALFEKYDFFQVKVLTNEGDKIPYIPNNPDLEPIVLDMEFGGVFSVTVMSNTLNLATAQEILSQEQQEAIANQVQENASNYNYLECFGLFEEQQTEFIKWWEWQMNPEEIIMQGLNPVAQLPRVDIPIQVGGAPLKNLHGQPSADIPDGEIRLEVYTVGVDATNVLSGTQEGYGFVDENLVAQPFEARYLYHRESKTAFLIQYVEDENKELIPVAELTTHPVEIKLPPLPPGWSSGLVFVDLSVGGQQIPSDYLPYYANSLNLPASGSFEFGDFLTMVNAPANHFEYTNIEPLDIDVTLKNSAQTIVSPSVEILIDGVSYPVSEPPPAEVEPIKWGKCEIEASLVDQDSYYHFETNLPSAYLLQPGAHTFEVRADDGINTTLVEQNSIHFVDYPTDIDHPAFSNRQLAYEPRQLTLNAISLGGDETNIGAEVPEVGQQNNDVMIDSTVERQAWINPSSPHYVAVGPAVESGGVDSTALNNATQPQSFGESGAGKRLNITRLKAAAPEDLDKVTILDTGKIRIFEYGYGIPEIAYVYIAVDFQVVATAIINPTIVSRVEVIFDTQVGVFVTIGAEVLAGIADIKITINADIGVQIPVQFTWGATLDSDNCFYYGMFYHYVAEFLWGLIEVAEGDGTIFDDHTGHCVGLRQAQAQDDPPVPESSNPALATDGLGTTLAVWRSREGNIMASRLNGQTWSAAQPIVSNGKSGDPAIAFYAPGQAVVVWSQSGLTEPPAPGSSIPDVLKHQHLAYAVYSDKAGWSAPQNLTEPTTGDGQADLAGCMSTDPDCPAGGAVTAVWVHDDAGDVGQQQFRIYNGLYQDGSWALDEVDPANTGYSDTQPEVAYVAGTPLVAWVRDEDRDLTTLDDHRLMTRFLDGTSPVQSPVDHPGGANRASLVADGETVQLVFTVSDEADGLVSNRRSLYRALATCNNRTCAWSSGQLKDAYGRPIFAESPALTLDGEGQPTLTFRAMGFGPGRTPPGPLATIPDPIGVMAHTGELAQVDLSSELTLNVGQISYLTGDGAVNWMPDAVYDPVLDSIIVMTVQGVAPPVTGNTAYRLAADISQRTVAVTPDEALIFASTTRQPNFTLTGAEASGPSLQPGQTPEVMVELYNTGLSWTASPTQPLEIVATWDGGPGIGQTAGETTVTALAAGEIITPSLALTLPNGILDAEHELYLTANPFQPIAEQTAEDNQLIITLGGIPAPSGLQADTRAGIPAVYLNWIASNDPRVVGYRIYRLNNNSELAAVGSSLTNAWTDLEVELDQTYQYAVTAFTDNQLESQPSTLISATTQIAPESVYLPLILR